MFGQRQLHQNAVNFRIGILLGDQGQQVGLSGAGRQLRIVDVDPRCVACLLFAFVIEMRGGIVTHQDRGQTRFHPCFGQYRRGFFRESFTNLLRQRLPIDNSSCHDILPGLNRNKKCRHHSRQFFNKSTLEAPVRPSTDPLAERNLRKNLRCLTRSTLRPFAMGDSAASLTVSEALGYDASTESSVRHLR